MRHSYTTMAASHDGNESEFFADSRLRHAQGSFVSERASKSKDPDKCEAVDVRHLAHELPLFVEELSKFEIAVKRAHVNELLLQTLEHERGGVQVYETAPRCVQNEELQKEWTRYLDQTREHVQILTDLCNVMDLDPEKRNL